MIFRHDHVSIRTEKNVTVQDTCSPTSLLSALCTESSTSDYSTKKHEMRCTDELRQIVHQAEVDVLGVV